LKIIPKASSRPGPHGVAAGKLMSINSPNWATHMRYCEFSRRTEPVARNNCLTSTCDVRPFPMDFRGGSSLAAMTRG
jgi:hypothetical protein